MPIVAGGNWGPSPARQPADLAAGDRCPVTGDLGSGRLAGWASKAAVLPVEPGGEHNRRDGKGRCFVGAQRLSGGAW